MNIKAKTQLGVTSLTTSCKNQGLLRNNCFICNNKYLDNNSITFTPQKIKYKNMCRSQNLSFSRI
jgi:hypothetical protein